MQCIIFFFYFERELFDRADIFCVLYVPIVLTN